MQYENTHACVCTLVRRPDDSLEYYFDAIHLMSRQHLSPSGSSLDRLDAMVRPKLPPVCLHTAGIT